ncbi:MAG TPA: DUF4864 domain-containing protein [Reyranella sp.]|nr:DUF4864 domain-containing protein [Reyranella sp.]
MLARLACAASTLGLLLASGAAPAVAYEAGSMEARAVIQRQLDAFKHNDADSAFALASPSLKETYANPKNFLDSVRSGETPFFKRRIIEYHDFVTAGDDAAQSLVLVDEDSNVWTVVYKLARQPDGSWLVDGVVLVKSGAVDA